MGCFCLIAIIASRPVVVLCVYVRARVCANGLFNVIRTLCLQEANSSVSRGKITQYTVRVYDQHSGTVDKWTMNFSADQKSCLVPFCADCEVTVLSHNSKGASPPARVSTRHGTGSALSPCRKTNNFNDTLESLCVFVCDSHASIHVFSPSRRSPPAGVDNSE